MDTTKTEDTVGTEETEAVAASGGDGSEAPAQETAAEDSFATEQDEESAQAELAALEAARAGRSVVGFGAAALVALGLALASLTGTWIGTVMAQREQLIGQIAAQAHPSEQLALQFGSPWHTTELFNGVFALAAALVAAVVLISQTGAERPASATVPWIRAVAWGAVVLGVIGLVVAGLMYFDVFTALPHLPTSTPPAG